MRKFYIVLLMLIIFGQATFAAGQNIFCLETLPDPILEQVNAKMLGSQDFSSLIVQLNFSSNDGGDGRKAGLIKFWMMDEKFFQQAQIRFLDKTNKTPRQFTTLISNGKIITNESLSTSDPVIVSYTPKKRTCYYMFENMNFKHCYEFISLTKESQYYILKTKYETMLNEKKKYYEELTYYINRESLLIDKIEVYEERPKPVMNRSVEYSQYVSINGIMFPTLTKTQTFFDGQWICDESYGAENVEINVTIPEEIFLP